MTDATAFLNFCVTTTQNFNRVYEDLKSISDRIGADSALSNATATAAQATSRKELQTQDFDNLKACIDLLSALLNTSQNGTVTATANVATVKLGFYKIL